MAPADTLPMRKIEPTDQHQAFYQDVFFSAKRNGLSDGETVAMLALILGRFIGNPGNKPEDTETFVETTLFNIRQGKADVGALATELRGTSQ